MSLTFKPKTFIITLFLSLLFCKTAVAQKAENENNDSINKPKETALLQIDSISNRSSKQYTTCDSDYIYQYTKPEFWDMFRYIPNDLYKFGLFTIQKENLKWDALVLGTTLAAIPYDQKILDDFGKIGNKMGGWDKDSKYKSFLGLTIIPQNIPSAVYYMGNGGTTLILSGIFYGIGKLSNNDYRALNTSSELVECLFSVGLTTQTIKRITGRQSPVRAIADGNDGGAWNPFPSFSAYQSNTPNYDAMPSGHIATFMASLTVIATNYPEIKWIKPVGYSMMGVLAFNMVSGKVHWTSDYPIGIFIGYVIGKEIANRRITKIPKQTIGMLPPKPKGYKLNYTFNTFNTTPVMGAVVTF
ncbi:phosphatase PAP2 family protein [Flavobacterium sp.]